MNKILAFGIVMLALWIVMYAVQADHNVDHAPDPDFSVDFVTNPDDGLVYFWCHFGCDEFITLAPFNELGQGFQDTSYAADALTIWFNRKYGTNNPTLNTYP